MPAIILLADDNDLARSMYADAFRAEGYQVVEASNGQEALQIARMHSPDAIIMDIAMPVMDGVLATRTLRGIPELTGVFVVACSGMPVNAEPGLFDYVVTKPVAPSALVTIVAQMLLP